MNTPTLALLLMQDVATPDALSERITRMDAARQASKNTSTRLAALMQETIKIPECEGETVSMKGDRFEVLYVTFGPPYMVHHSDFEFTSPNAGPDATLCRDATLNALYQKDPSCLFNILPLSDQPGILATCVFLVSPPAQAVKEKPKVEDNTLELDRE